MKKGKFEVLVALVVEADVDEDKGIVYFGNLCEQIKKIEGVTFINSTFKVLEAEIEDHCEI